MSAPPAARGVKNFDAGNNCNYLYIQMVQCQFGTCYNYKPINVFFKDKQIATIPSQTVDNQGNLKLKVRFDPAISGTGDVRVDLYYNKASPDCKQKPPDPPSIIKIVQIDGYYYPPSSPPSPSPQIQTSPPQSIAKNIFFWIILVVMIASVICIILGFVL
jgi:hypothetical protein